MSIARARWQPSTPRPPPHVELGCSANGLVTLSALTNPVLYVQSPAGATSCLDSTGNDYTFGGLIQSNDYYAGAIAYYDSGNSHAAHKWTYTQRARVFRTARPAGLCLQQR